MHEVLAAVLASTEVDPAAARPSPQTTAVVGFLLIATVLLIWSFLRHLRRAQENLGSSRAATSDPADPAAAADSDADPP